MQNSDAIRQRVHRIWEAEGRLEGRYAEHWAKAQDELRREGVLHGDSPSVDNHDDYKLADDRSPARQKDHQRDAPRDAAFRGGTDEIVGAAADDDMFD